MMLLRGGEPGRWGAGCGRTQRAVALALAIAWANQSALGGIQAAAPAVDSAADPATRRPPALARILADIEAGRLDAAREALAVIVRDPRAPPAAHFLLGRVLADQYRLAEAASALGIALAQRPDRPAWWETLARVELDRGRPAAAAEAAARALALAPSVTAAYLRGASRVASGDLRAAGDFETALALDALHLPSLVELARLRADEGAWALARRHLDRALADPAADASVRALRARVALEQGDLAQAERDLEQALAVAPEQAEAWFTRARLLAARQAPAGEREAALARFRDASATQERLERTLLAAQLEPTNAATRRQAAELLLAAGRPQEAVRQLRAAVVLDPADAASAARLATLAGGSASTVP